MVTKATIILKGNGGERVVVVGGVAYKKRKRKTSNSVSGQNDTLVSIPAAD